MRGKKFIPNGTFYFGVAFLMTFLLVRIVLHSFPALNLNAGPYNVHHLFVGSFLLVITTIFFVCRYSNNITFSAGGISSALIIDELIYLIATDGSDKSYLSSVSLNGALLFVVITFLLLGGLTWWKK